MSKRANTLADQSSRNHDNNEFIRVNETLYFNDSVAAQTSIRNSFESSKLYTHGQRLGPAIQKNSSGLLKVAAATSSKGIINVNAQ